MGNGLFVCSHNMGRRPMAPAVFERHAPKHLRERNALTSA